MLGGISQLFPLYAHAFVYLPFSIVGIISHSDGQSEEESSEDLHHRDTEVHVQDRTAEGLLLQGLIYADIFTC